MGSLGGGNLTTSRHTWWEDFQSQRRGERRELKILDNRIIHQEGKQREKKKSLKGIARFSRRPPDTMAVGLQEEGEGSLGSKGAIP